MAIILDKTTKSSCLGYDTVLYRILVVHLDTMPVKTTIIKVYAPTSTSSDEDKEDFYIGRKKEVSAMILHNKLCFIVSSRSPAVLIHNMFCFIVSSRTPAMILHNMFCFIVSSTSPAMIIHNMFCFIVSSTSPAMIIHNMFCFIVSLRSPARAMSIRSGGSESFKSF